MNIDEYEQVLKYLSINDINNLGITCKKYNTFNIYLKTKILYNYIKYYNLNDIKKLICNNSNITDLNFINKFPNLEYLDISHNILILIKIYYILMKILKL